MNNEEYVKSIAGMFNFLAEIFYQNPTEELKDTISTLEIPLFVTKDANFNKLVFNHISELKTLAQQLPVLALKQDFNILFVRPKGKKAYPWGSVYLNNQNRLFDQSTLDFMDFCQSNNLNFNLTQHEPTDHFALMLVALVYCLELDLQEQQNRTKQLLEQHLLTWSDRFLCLVAEHSESRFYGASAELCMLLLEDIKQANNIELKPVELFK
ncbi:TorD/DmsD family molecular chaperone [Shewanella donghaensis]|uniref:TorD/DmsD family molecular chaperone n=1 Tax=Shewanella donghaensis TaxID=238836 RepID=UPI0011831FED|nr:molecular chaperone TorD family protein [Shewanella donghaensis]